jgi:hypothetical protein
VKVCRANHVPLSFMARARRAFAGKAAMVDGDGMLGGLGATHADGYIELTDRGKDAFC